MLATGKLRHPAKLCMSANGVIRQALSNLACRSLALLLSDEWDRSGVDQHPVVEQGTQNSGSVLESRRSPTRDFRHQPAGIYGCRGFEQVKLHQRSEPAFSTDLYREESLWTLRSERVRTTCERCARALGKSARGRMCNWERFSS